MSWRGLAVLLLLAGWGWAAAAWAQSNPAPADWTDADIRMSRTHAPDVPALPQAPPRRAGPAQRLVVVTADPPQVTLIDVARLQNAQSIALPRAPHGAPRFSADGRHGYFATRDGWITRVDLWNLRVLGEVRVGRQLANFAISSDGKWLLAGNEAPHTLVLLDAELALVKRFAAATPDGKHSSRVGVVTDAAPRTSFVVALRDVAEIWEISYDPRAEDIYAGLVHDFRMSEGLPVRGFHNARRSFLAQPLGNLFFDAEHTHLVGSAEGSPATAQVVNLDVRRRIASVELSGRPLLAAGHAFAWNGMPALAVPDAQHGAIDVIDMRSWKLARTVTLPSAASWVGGRSDAPLLWTDGAGGTVLTAIAKASLALSATLRLPGPALAPLVFGHDGRRLLACIGGAPGLLVAYDAQTLQEIERLAMPHAITGCTSVPPHVER
ncbi:MAG: cytochrome D1 domain-containing protein [Rubrivivax sp.]|nr:cytochrome D1 domain-containing protein [Rubrivivax sp.]MDP3610261.1 cytochrome D1 domain-containing protein [Rubrivivax sp.]